MKIFTVMYVNFEAISKETPVQKLKEKLENFQYFLCLLRCIAELVSVNFMIFSVFQVTKEKYWNKPTYSSLRSSLEAMRDHCNTHKVTKLSMPRIGCGLDGLQWNKVLELIKDVFRETDVKITVYTL
mgnify:CR=1 FL=1